ncbi:hypothetical protein [Wolbachia endosymbiont (group B) of Philonthus cognatus]|uniref:hypothetical protein n=1 Tax=Wolbachia endosymbiont (group B) of Philonthus cognatus TaxID=2954047 RepID=UPI00221FF4C1|nr:hypothetical protein [Wolbachia endosymbiont (group B) of Philonthus cognatus]
MSILKTHRHKTNIAIVAFTSLYVIGTAVALSTPYWVSSTSILAQRQLQFLQLHHLE